MNHFVSSSDFMGFERNPMKSYRELDKPRLTSRYIRLRRHSKWHWQNTLSVRVISLDSKEILWNRIENSTTPSYFSIHFACFFKTNKTLEVTSIILSVRVMERRQPSHCIENSTTPFYFSIHPLKAALEVTLTKHLVSSRDFIGFERNPMKSYRELD
jgi:hypothetical protein